MTLVAREPSCAATDRLGPPFGPALRLLLLTGQRLREIAELQASEIIADGGMLTFAAHRTKNKRAHFVPLAPMARDVLCSVPRLAGCTYVFSTNGRTPVSGWSKVKRRLDALMAQYARTRARTPICCTSCTPSKKTTTYEVITWNSLPIHLHSLVWQ